MESEHGSGSSKHSKELVDANVKEDNLVHLGKMSTPDMESGNHGASNKPSQTPAEATVIEDDLHDVVNRDKSAPSSPSSSSSSFDEDFFLMDESLPRKSDVGSASLNDTFHDFPPSNPVSPRPPSLPDTPVASPDSCSPSKSPNQSPPIQMMDRLEVPDPNRIPSTLFARTKSTAPAEWSMQSNESLFSIHMGNNSFSRDQVFLMGRSQELGLGGLGISQELGLGGLNNHQESGKSEDMFKFNSAGVVANSDKRSSGMDVAEAAAETMKEVIRESAKDHNKRKPSTEGIRPSISHRSEGSGASTMSFAFPILTKDATKNSSVKPETEKKQQEEQPQESQPNQPAANAIGSSWFSCFSCSFCR